MRKYLRIAMVLFGFAGLSAAANAQIVDQIVVTVPFEFAINGTTLPAGIYHVHRMSDDPSNGLVFSSHENHVIAAVIPADVKSASAKNPKLSFETVGDVHFLNRIETANHVFAIPVSKEKVKEALARNNAVSFGSSGTN